MCRDRRSREIPLEKPSYLQAQKSNEPYLPEEREANTVRDVLQHDLKLPSFPKSLHPGPHTTHPHHTHAPLTPSPFLTLQNTAEYSESFM